MQEHVAATSLLFITAMSVMHALTTAIMVMYGEP